jgi:hypothetical protein
VPREVAGLEQRVEWERADVAELEIYIPHTVEISDCAYQP